MDDNGKEETIGMQSARHALERSRFYRQLPQGDDWDSVYKRYRVMRLFDRVQARNAKPISDMECDIALQRMLSYRWSDGAR